MTLKLPTDKKMISILRAWFLVGIAGFSLPFSHSLFTRLIPLSIILVTAVMILYHKPLTRAFLITLLVTAAAGYGVEVMGIATGFPFGNYEYGRVLGPAIAGVPILIGINWVLMVYGGVSIASMTSLPLVPGSLLSAAIMTLSDYFIEKFAILTGMWQWYGGIPPLQNYAGWFVVSALLSALCYPYIKGQRRDVAIAAYIWQLLFFIVTLIINYLLWE